eukprot:scaffold923_cov288-Pavlova_lutheri.AAC.2
MGEGQILAQVKQVFKVGQECNGFGRQLSGLFKHAITCGKRVRSETNIASGAVSVSSAAAELAQLKLPTQNWASARVAIIGAGKMSRLLVKHLASKGCSEMTVVNRSAARVEELQNDFPDVQINMKLMPDLMEVVSQADVVFAASGSESILVRKNDLEGMATPPEVVGSVRRFVDISVPRNIDPAIAELESGVVYNVDDLKEVVVANKKQRAAAATAAEALIFEEQDAFEAWRRSLETVPTIKRLRAKAEDIRQAELEKTLSKLGDNLSKKERRAIEDLSRGIVNKLLHGPMQALRSDATDANSIDETLENMYALERMFDLKEDFVFPDGTQPGRFEYLAFEEQGWWYIDEHVVVHIVLSRAAVGKSALRIPVARQTWFLSTPVPVACPSALHVCRVHFRLEPCVLPDTPMVRVSDLPFEAILCGKEFSTHRSAPPTVQHDCNATGSAFSTAVTV